MYREASAFGISLHCDARIQIGLKVGIFFRLKLSQSPETRRKLISKRSRKIFRPRLALWYRTETLKLLSHFHVIKGSCGAGRRGAELRGTGGQWGRTSLGRTSLGQYPWGKTSWGRRSVGQEVSGAELRGAGRRWGKISGAVGQVVMG